MTENVHKNIIQQEQLTALQSELKKLNSQISQAERFLSADPRHEPTLNRHVILTHNRSELLTKIRKIKECA